MDAGAVIVEGFGLVGLAALLHPLVVVLVVQHWVVLVVVGVLLIHVLVPCGERGTCEE